MDCRLHARCSSGLFHIPIHWVWLTEMSGLEDNLASWRRRDDCRLMMGFAHDANGNKVTEPETAMKMQYPVRTGCVRSIAWPRSANISCPDLPELHHTDGMQAAEGQKTHIDFPPVVCIVYTAGMPVVVVVVTLAPENRIYRENIFRGIVHWEIGVTEAVCPPVYCNTLHRAHKELQRQKQPHPPLRGKEPVKGEINA